MENWQVALIVILAILVGVMIPAIVQFQLAMRELGRVAGHLNQVGSIVESNRKQIETFFESLRGIGQSVDRIHSAVRTASVIGAAIGPLLAAAIKARRETASEESKLNGHSQERRIGNDG
jgi:hypothetical protein